MVLFEEKQPTSVICKFSFFRFYNPENHKKPANTKETQKPGDLSPISKKPGIMTSVRLYDMNGIAYTYSRIVKAL